MKHWANTPADIQVGAKDVLYIPKRPNSVMVSGEVYNPTAVTYKPGRSAGWYLQQAGGPTNVANKKAIFVSARMDRWWADVAGCLAAAQKAQICGRAIW